jgi:hypothetical protein
LEGKRKPLLKSLAENDLGKDEYEPVQLWLLPILLRTRQQYYDDAIAKVKRDIEHMWQSSGSLYPTREAFDSSDFVDGVWRRASPYWWGLNDIAGFIDIRANVGAAAIEATLFLTSKRPSKRLVDKLYVHRRRERVELRGGETNDDLQSATDAVVTRLAGDSRIKRRYLDIDGWRLVLSSTDLVRLLRSEIKRHTSR